MPDNKKANKKIIISDRVVSDREFLEKVFRGEATKEEIAEMHRQSVEGFEGGD